MCVVATLFCVSMPTASILFNVVSCVVPTLVVDGEDECGLFCSGRWLLMD